MLMLASRGGSSALSHGCRSTTRRNHRPHGPLTTACATCSSVRLTAKCSASTALQLGRIHAVDHRARTMGSASSLPVKRVQLTHFGNVMNPAVVAWNPTDGAACSVLRRTIYLSSAATNALSSHPLVGIFGGQNVGVMATATPSEESSSAWTLRDLVAAMLFAGAASTAGSMLLGGRIGRLPGQGGGGGGGDPGDGNGGRSPVDEKHKNSFDVRTKEEEQEGNMDLGLEVVFVPKPYEVSVRALRGGRLSMEDEFVVVSGGRLSAVFDGHGGGGVSQYLRDHLHVIIAEQLQQQEQAREDSKFRGDLKRFMFGKGLQGEKHTQGTKYTEPQGDDGANADAYSQSVSRGKFDLSHIGQLPLSAVATALKDSFDQVDKEIMKNDEYEYQGSTAVAALLHETSAGARTLVSANIGDSRGILSRNSRAIDLTRDHKPNDDKEKARLLAMGEKIEWDHYCKVHRVRNLSLSRALGDRFAKPAVSGEVEIKQFPIYNDKDEFLLLASDGLWDVMASQEVVSYIHKRLMAPPKDGADITCEEDMASLTCLRRKNMSRFIANEALRRGSGDNISVVIVWLSDCDPL